MMKNHKTRPFLVGILMVLLFAFGSLFVSGQSGTGREPPKPPKTTTLGKGTAPPRRNPAASRQSSCSAESPRQATGRTHIVDLSGGVKLEMVEIPAGSFCMGSKYHLGDEKPVHRVKISSAFYIGKYEVTQAQWQSVMGNNPSYYKECVENCPVEQVSWNDAQSWINKLNELNDAFTYRLPTEAEWEYACRAGTTTAFAFGDSLSFKGAFGEHKIMPVGGFQPNAFGLYDMHGNVWEWCEDWLHNNYNGAPTDGGAWLSGGEQKYRVLRGGSWASDATNLRSASRDGDAPDFRGIFNGFRVVAVR